MSPPAAHPPSPLRPATPLAPLTLPSAGWPFPVQLLCRSAVTLPPLPPAAAFVPRKLPSPAPTHRPPPSHLRSPPPAAARAWHSPALHDQQLPAATCPAAPPSTNLKRGQHLTRWLPLCLTPTRINPLPPRPLPLPPWQGAPCSASNCYRKPAGYPSAAPPRRLTHCLRVHLRLAAMRRPALQRQQPCRRNPPAPSPGPAARSALP